jgi:hypothetical protein
MSFWSNPASVMPKQLHRWVVTFGNKSNESGNKPKFLAKSVDLPSYEIGNVQAKYLFSYNVNFPKRLTWKPITITLYDAVINASGDPSTQSSFANPSNLGYTYLSTNKYTFKEVVNSDLVGNGKLTITQLSPNGTANDSWELESAILSEVKFDKLDYSQEGVQTVTLTVNYDNATLTHNSVKEDDYLLIDPKELQRLRTQVSDLQGFNEAIIKQNINLQNDLTSQINVANRVAELARQDRRFYEAAQKDIEANLTYQAIARGAAEKSEKELREKLRTAKTPVVIQPRIGPLP